MTAQVYMYVAQAQEVVRIPNDALRFRPTRAAYLALGGVPPKEDAQRAVEHQSDKIVDPTALRPRELDGDAQTIDRTVRPLAGGGLPARPSGPGTRPTSNLSQRRFASGVTDGNMTVLLSGDVQVGDELVTGVFIPMPANGPNAANPLLGRRGR